MKKIIIVIISFLIFIGLICGLFYYISGTPKYSINKFIKAIENRDSINFNKYADTERIFRNFIEDASQESILGESLIQNTKEKIQNDINKSIENPSDELQAKAKNIKIKEIKKNGKTAKVILKNDNNDSLEMDLIQTSDRYWKIVKININDYASIFQKTTITLAVTDSEINIDEFKKKILGKNEEQLKEILRKYPQIKKINIEYYPSLLEGKIPEKENKVEIKTEKSAEKTKGKVTIYNEFSPDPQTLLATTRLLSENGKIFRLVNETIIPGYKKTSAGIEAGTIEAEIIADEAGNELDTNSSKLVFPGFKSTNDERFVKLYAKTLAE